MSSISSEKKMQLAKIIRDEHQNNRMKMQNREEFLYGKRSYYDTSSSIEKQENITKPDISYSSSSLRFLIAIVLLIGFIVWDNSQVTVMGKSSDAIYTWLKDESVMTNVIDFMGNITYTGESVEPTTIGSDDSTQGEAQKD